MNTKSQDYNGHKRRFNLHFSLRLRSLSVCALALVLSVALILGILPTGAGVSLLRAADTEQPNDPPLVEALAEPPPPQPIPLEAAPPRLLYPSRVPAGSEVGASSAAFTYDPTSAYDQKGLSGPRGFSAQAPNELVDPYTGNLIVRHVDLHLPGVAGLDVTLTRIYNIKIHRNYAKKTSDPNGMLFVPPTPLGLGWSMHMGRLIGADNGGPNNTLLGPRYYERSDGSQNPFFQYSGTGCGNQSSDICYVTQGFENPYRICIKLRKGNKRTG